MSAIEHLTISLSAEAAQRLRARIESGDYRDASAVIEDALASLDSVGGLVTSEGEQAEERWLSTEVAAACDELDRDPSSAIPIDRVITELSAARTARGE